eukprot:jgi/Chlat1/6340/Chrsp44S05899
MEAVCVPTLAAAADEADDKQLQGLSVSNGGVLVVGLREAKDGVPNGQAASGKKSAAAAAAAAGVSGLDALTYAFVVAWSALCCLLVRARPEMWQVGASAAFFAAISKGSGLVGERLPWLKQLEDRKQRLWHNTFVSYIHSILITIGCIYVLTVDFHRLNDMVWGHSARAYSVVSVSAGYFAYDTFDMVSKRLYNPRNPGILAHHAVLLVCFTTALYRDFALFYLLLTLACEAHSVFLHQRRLLQLSGYKNARVNNLNWKLNWVTFWGFRAGVHAVLPVVLLKQRELFPHWGLFGMAFGGMIVFNYMNWELWRDLRRARRREMKGEGKGREGEHED